MADGVDFQSGTLATPAAGVKVATDDGGGSGQVQIVKLALSADGSAVPIGADANGLDVDIARALFAVADGGALPAAIAIIGGYDGANAQAVAVDAGGVVQVDVLTIPSVTVGAALPAGNNNIGDVDVASIAAGTNLIGDVGVRPRTSGGLTIYRSIDLDETEEEIKATAGQLFGWYLFNAAATVRYVKLYNATAATVVVGTTTPVLTIPVPPGSAANVFSDIGIAFGTAITAAATTGVADADTGAPAANDVIANFFYA